MPFCTNCGNQVGATDKFCAACGAPQSVRSSAATPGDMLRGMSPRTASVLCYVPLIGWLASIVVLASPGFQNDRTTRFHAFQGLYLFVAWLLVEMIASPLVRFRDMSGVGHAVGGILHLAIFVAWIIMLI